MYLDFVHVDIGSITHTTLSWEAVVGMLGTVTGENLNQVERGKLNLNLPSWNHRPYEHGN